MAIWDTPVLTNYVIVQPSGAYDVEVETVVNVGAVIDNGNDVPAAQALLREARENVIIDLDELWKLGYGAFGVIPLVGTPYEVAYFSIHQLSGPARPVLFVKATHRDTKVSHRIDVNDMPGTLLAAREKAPQKAAPRGRVLRSKRK